jgi:hypothetical protein
MDQAAGAVLPAVQEVPAVPVTHPDAARTAAIFTRARTVVITTIGRFRIRLGKIARTSIEICPSVTAFLLPLHQQFHI